MALQQPHRCAGWAHLPPGAALRCSWRSMSYLPPLPAPEEHDVRILAQLWVWTPSAAHWWLLMLSACLPNLKLCLLCFPPFWTLSLPSFLCYLITPFLLLVPLPHHVPLLYFWLCLLVIFFISYTRNVMHYTADALLLCCVVSFSKGSPSHEGLWCSFCFWTTKPAPHGGP